MAGENSILLAENEEVEAFTRGLEGVGFGVETVRSVADCLAAVGAREFDTVVVDLALADPEVLDLIGRLQEIRPLLPVILITARRSTRMAIEATKRGAYDFLLKRIDIEEFIELIRKAVDTKRMMADRVELGNRDAEQDAIIGSSRAMLKLYKAIGRVAAKPVDVLVCGETGTGKELASRALYQYSDRSEFPFVAVNCAAIPETLLESELFGHEKGAFTGATERRIGRFEQAMGGTLFLDEIGELSPATQSKLLRVLQEKQIYRLGGKQAIPVTTRVIAATNRNLETEVKEKRFRRDLYYRLNSVVITLPPLADRSEDIPDLVEFFLRKHGSELGVSDPSITPDAITYLQERPWPGNVRELENFVRKALLASRGFTITVDDLSSAVAAFPNASQPGGQSISDLVSSLLIAAKNGEASDVHATAVEKVEREVIALAISLAESNQAKAARWLGLSRPTLREKLMNYGLHPSQLEEVAA